MRATIESRGEVGAGRMAKMVIEAREARAAAESGWRRSSKGERGRVCSGKREWWSECLRSASADGAAVRQFQLIFVQAARQGEARGFRASLQAIELLFLDGEENGLFVKKRDPRSPDQ